MLHSPFDYLPLTTLLTPSYALPSSHSHMYPSLSLTPSHLHSVTRSPSPSHPHISTPRLTFSLSLTPSHLHSLSHILPLPHTLTSPLPVSHPHISTPCLTPSHLHSLSHILPAPPSHSPAIFCQTLSEARDVLRGGASEAEEHHNSTTNVAE